MTSPDLTPYVDLKVYDKTPDDIKAAALTYLQTTLPDWNPQEGNVEMLLLEAIAIEVAEAVYSINRLPQTMVEVLLGLYGIERLPGTPALGYAKFTMFDAAGYTVPAGTEVGLTVDNLGTVVSFTTLTDCVIMEGNTFNTVAIQSTTNTDAANNVATGIALELITPIYAVEAVEIATTPIHSGTDPETSEEMLLRGIQKLQRLSETLVLPVHFTQAALERTDLGVYRANTIDNYNAGTAAGHVTVAVYGETGVVATDDKTALATYLTGKAISNLVVHVIDAEIETQAVSVTVKKLAAYTTQQVTDNVTAAVNGYLNPATWDWSGTVRRNSLISLITHAEGVDFVSTLTTPAADVEFSATDGFTLVDAGTITVTVT